MRWISGLLSSQTAAMIIGASLLSECNSMLLVDAYRLQLVLEEHFAGSYRFYSMDGKTCR